MNKLTYQSLIKYLLGFNIAEPAIQHFLLCRSMSWIRLSSVSSTNVALFASTQLLRHSHRWYYPSSRCPLFVPSANKTSTPSATATLFGTGTSILLGHFFHLEDLHPLCSWDLHLLHYLQGNHLRTEDYHSLVTKNPPPPSPTVQNQKRHRRQQPMSTADLHTLYDVESYSLSQGLPVPLSISLALSPSYLWSYPREPATSPRSAAT